MLKKKIRIRKALQSSEDFREVNVNRIGVFGKREVMVVKCAGQAILAVHTGIAEYGDPRVEIFVVDLKKKFGGNFSAKATLSRRFDAIEDRNSFQEATARCVPVE